MAFCLAIIAGKILERCLLSYQFIKPNVLVSVGTAAGYVQNPDNKACSSASIAFIYIFGCVFAISFTSMQPIYPGEVLSNDMRAKGMGVFQLTSGTAGFVNTFAAPIEIGRASC